MVMVVSIALIHTHAHIFMYWNAFTLPFGHCLYLYNILLFILVLFFFRPFFTEKLEFVVTTGSVFVFCWMVLKLDRKVVCKSQTLPLFLRLNIPYTHIHINSSWIWRYLLMLCCFFFLVVVSSSSCSLFALFFSHTFNCFYFY